MAKTKKLPVAKTKKDLKKEVAGTLAEVFSDIKNAVGEKEFDKKIKKATKILSAGALKKASKKKSEDKKATDKKAGKTKKKATVKKPAAKTKKKKVVAGSAAPAGKAE
ncbi:MAG: hypothetical protein QM687_03675 [Ferruginibacter sp.]